MDALVTLFLESPFQLAAFSLVLLLIAYAIWLRARSEVWKFLILPVVLGVIVLLFAIQTFVTTKREDLRLALDRVIAAVARNDVAAIRPAIAAEYADGDMDRANLLEFIDAALKNTDVHDGRIGAMQINVDDGRATMEFSITATVRVRGFIGRVPSRWRLDWIRAPDRWRISRIEPLEVAGSRCNGLRSLRAW